MSSREFPPPPLIAPTPSKMRPVSTSSTLICVVTLADVLVVERALFDAPDDADNCVAPNINAAAAGTI